MTPIPWIKCAKCNVNLEIDILPWWGHTFGWTHFLRCPKCHKIIKLRRKDKAPK